MTENYPTDEDHDTEPNSPVPGDSGDPNPGAPTASAGSDESRMSTVRRYVYWATLVALVGLGGFSFLLFYSDLRTAITVFVADEYVLLVQSAVHLVLLLLAGIGVSLIVRRLEGPGD